MKRTISILGFMLMIGACKEGKLPTSSSQLPAIVPVIIKTLPVCTHHVGIQRQGPKLSIKQDDSGRIIAVEVEIMGASGWESYEVSGGPSPVITNALWQRLFRVRTASEVCKSEWAEQYVDDPNPTGPAELPPVVIPPVDPPDDECKPHNYTWGGHHPKPCHPKH